MYGLRILDVGLKIGIQGFWGCVFGRKWKTGLRARLKKKEEIFKGLGPI